jgi:shikimate dehydrogenase
MINLGLIGKYIQNSQAPNLFKKLSQDFDLPLTYELFDLKDNDNINFRDYIKNIKNKKIDGLNVTFPFKEEAAKLSDIKGEEVELTKSSNLLIFKNKITARNTDLLGFEKLLNFHFDKKFKNILVIGAGGVGRSICFALTKFGLEKLYLVEKDSEKLKKITLELQNQGTKVISLNEVEPHNEIIFEGVLNCTPIGHEHSLGNPLENFNFNNVEWVFDAVYVPAETEFVKKAKKSKIKVISGIDLFIFQGIEGFLLFTEKEKLRDKIYKNINKIRKFYFDKLT